MPDQDLIFVLMPFDGISFDNFDKVIIPAVESLEMNLSCVKADDISVSGEMLMQKIWKMIFSSRLIIAELTDINANDMYELGIADTMGKPVIMMWDKSKGDRPPFDVGPREILFYNTSSASGYDEWRDRLNISLESILKSDPYFLEER